MAMKVYSEIDGVTLLYGDIDEKGSIPVYFERVGSNGEFDFAEGKIPYCSFERTSGFSELELEQMRGFLRNNLLVIFDDASGLE